MHRSYRNGLMIVGAAVALGCGLAAFVPPPTPARAAEELPGAPGMLGAFDLVERSGRPVHADDLAPKVWIAGFTFSRCPTSCPRISAALQGLQGRLARSGVTLVSLSVDPEFDTPAVLSKYADRFNASDRWLFLTGSTYPLIARFGLGEPQLNPESLTKSGAEAISHSSRLALVDRGNAVVGFYDADDPEAIQRLAKRAVALDYGWVYRLPTVNASLNGTCAVLLTIGWLFIRAGRVRPHIACMATAVAVSGVFLGSYLVYHYMVGSVPFRGVGPTRFAYFAVLLSHTALAATVVPLVGLTLWRAVTKRFEAHARIARVTLPIWLYVSITGVVVYVMLYRLDLAAGGGKVG